MKSPTLIALSALLLAQAAGYYLLPDSEVNFQLRPLTELSRSIGSFNTAAEFPLEQEVRDVLKASDTLNRTYVMPGRAHPINLFIAFFKSQKAGAAPHSPKNCLPGSGFAPVESGMVAIDIPSSGETVTVNRYVVARGDEKSLVMYWYQTPKRIVASEYAAKFWLAVDSIRYRRSDTSLVRVVVPIGAGETAPADALAKSFIQSALPELNRVLPRL